MTWPPWFREEDEYEHAGGQFIGTLLLRGFVPFWWAVSVALAVIVGRELWKAATRHPWDELDFVRDVRAGLCGMAFALVIAWVFGA